MIEALFEKRSDSSTLGTPKSWLMKLLGGGTNTAAGVNINEDNALSLASVFAAIRNISEDVAKLPTITYKKLVPEGKERAEDDSLYFLLRYEPNPEMHAFNFKAAVTAQALLWGAGYAEIERDNAGRAIALWPINSRRVSVKRNNATQKLYYEVSQESGSRNSANIDSDDMMIVNGFTLDGIVGCMLSKYAGESLALTMAAERFGATYFGNGAHPGGVFQTPNSLSDKAYDRLKKSVAEDAGISQSHKTKILEEGLTWAKQTYNPTESQFLETRQFQTDEVARWFRIPPHKLQNLLRSTNNNIEQQSIEYVSDTLLPWLVKWELEYKRKLMRKMPLFAEHLLDSILRGEALARAQALQVQFQNGIITQDEWRGLENRNPLPDGLGKKHYVMQNMTTVEQMAENNGQKPQKPVDGAKRCLLEAHKGLLSDALRCVLKVEIEKVQRTAKKGGDFRALYTEHEVYFRTKIGPILEAFAASLHGIECGKPLGADQQRELVIFAAGSAAKHTALSMQDLQDMSAVESKIAAWDKRCEAFADSEIEQLASLIITFEKRGKHAA